ncbi:hypothetical protein GGF40_004280 [Coemansia sp. RSA 1286]|nr:hypothetical protein IWW45_001666 [Coemansia sp. RSA 485]KAJ2634311.1 hypothetical protein GGF40_004280 [Coemansia sp. RSA 1286]
MRSTRHLRLHGSPTLQHCLSSCTSTRCKENCRQAHESSDEDIVKRTQKCTVDCKSEPEELVAMCIQRCTYYLMDPVAHSIEEKVSETAEDGLLAVNEHIRTRIRLIGPDGLPLETSSVSAIPTSVAHGQKSPVETETWQPKYRVMTINNGMSVRLLAGYGGLWIWTALASSLLLLLCVL